MASKTYSINTEEPASWKDMQLTSKYDQPI